MAKAFSMEALASGNLLKLLKRRAQDDGGLRQVVWSQRFRIEWPFDRRPVQFLDA